MVTKNRSTQVPVNSKIKPGRSPTDAEIIAAARRDTDRSIAHGLPAGTLPGHTETDDAWNRRFIVRFTAPQLFADIENADDLVQRDRRPTHTESDMAEALRRCSVWQTAVHARRLEIQKASANDRTDRAEILASIAGATHAMHMAVPSRRIVKKQGLVWRRHLEDPAVIAEMTEKMMAAHPDVDTARRVWSIAVVLAAARCQVWELRAALHIAKQIRARKNARIAAKRAVKS